MMPLPSIRTGRSVGPDRRAEQRQRQRVLRSWRLGDLDVKIEFHGRGRHPA